jgi:dTDP-4-dehydrorhamnose 3,5-epimerase-like enzyme
MLKLFNLETHGDDRGSLAVIESSKNIPFDIKRVYYLFHTNPDQERGKHAHKNLKQIYIAVSGSCKIEFDDGKTKSEYVLNNPAEGLLIEGVVWREIKEISKDCILLVLADDHYKEEDYIRSHKEFLNYIKNN